MREHKLPKLLKSVFHLTANDDKLPTDIVLDEKIELLKYYMIGTYPLMLEIIKKKIYFLFRYKWKNLVKKLLVLIILLVTSYYAWINIGEPVFIYRQQTKFISGVNQELAENPIPKETLLFMTSLANLESGSNYNITNGQYWGAFQMGTMARNAVGLGSMPKETFLKETNLQNWAALKLIQLNYQYLHQSIVKYQIPIKGGKKIGNHLVTLSGLIAASHLVGYTEVKRFLDTNGKVIASDGNGVPLTKYLELNNFDLKIN